MAAFCWPRCRRRCLEVSSGGKADGAWKPRPRQVSDRQAGGAVNPPPVFSWHWWLVILSSPATVPVREQGSMDSPSISLEHGALSAMP